MWARLNDNDTIAQLYMRPVGITLDGVQYPASIFSLWSSAELKALKIWSVTMTNQPSDSKYHNVSGPEYAVTKDGDTVTGVTGTYTSTEKPLKDVRWTDFRTAGCAPIRAGNEREVAHAGSSPGNARVDGESLPLSPSRFCSRSSWRGYHPGRSLSPPEQSPLLRSEPLHLSASEFRYWSEGSGSSSGGSCRSANAGAPQSRSSGRRRQGDGNHGYAANV